MYCSTHKLRSLSLHDALPISDPATPETPDAPTVDSVTNNFNEQGEPTGTTVTGKAEPGHTVVIRDKDGNVIGEGEADEDGKDRKSTRLNSSHVAISYADFCMK